MIDTHKVTCDDCGEEYPFGLDTVLSLAQWRLVHPESDEGILCANCIVKRAATVPGILTVRLFLEIAPWPEHD